MTPTEFERCSDHVRYQFELIEQAARLVLVHGKPLEEAARAYHVMAEDVSHVVRSYLEMHAGNREPIATGMGEHAPCVSLEMAA